MVAHTRAIVLREESLSPGSARNILGPTTADCTKAACYYLNMSELWRFVTEVLKYWQAYVTSGIITAIVNVGERLTGRSLPKKVYGAIF